MGFIGYFVKLIHIPMCVVSTFPSHCWMLTTFTQNRNNILVCVLATAYLVPLADLAIQWWCLIVQFALLFFYLPPLYNAIGYPP
jgi:hypothetical protein